MISIVMTVQFYLPEVLRILDLKRDRVQQWLDRGYVTPSIKKASGQGTRNIFSRADLYLIAVFKEIVEGGWSRKMAAKFIQAVKPAAIDKLIKIGSTMPYTLILEEIRAGSFRFPEIYRELLPNYSGPPDKLKDAAIAKLERLGATVELYLAFTINKTQELIDCYLIADGLAAEGLPRIDHLEPVKNGRARIGQWKDFGPGIYGRNYAFILNFGAIMNDVSKSIHKNYPDKIVIQRSEAEGESWRSPADQLDIAQDVWSEAEREAWRPSKLDAIPETISESDTCEPNDKEKENVK